jgi:hypothetical protein
MREQRLARTPLFCGLVVWGMVLCGARILAAADSTPVFVENPTSVGYVDVRAQYGAKGDGLADDTEAFQRAATEDVRRLWIPAGTYLIRDTLVFGPKRWILQGAGRSQTILKLADGAAGFGDPKVPRPFVSTFGPFMDPKAAMGQAFRTSLFDLTIDTGAKNPGAVGLHYLNNNQGTVRDVMIRSGDPERVGRAGLALVTPWPGPALFKNVRIEGFDSAVWSTISQFSLTFENLELVGYRECGIDNAGQTLAVRKLVAEGAGPAVRTRSSGGFVSVLDANCKAVGSVETAFEGLDEGALFLRDVETEGYTRAARAVVGGKRVDLSGPSASEWCSHRVLGTKGGTTLRLPVEETPVPESSTWLSVANAADFGAKTADGNDPEKWPDAAPGIQKAIDSGKSTVVLPFGTYAIRSTIELRGQVVRIVGCESRLRYLMEGHAPAFRVVDGESPVVFFDRIDGDYGSRVRRIIEHASTRTVVVRHSMIGRYVNTVPGGKVFVEDVCGGDWEFRGQSVWMRQINPEARGDDFNVRLVDSTYWGLGFKTEGPKTAITATNSRVELFGAFLYANRGTDKGAAAFDLTNSDLSAGWVNHLGGAYRPQVRCRDEVSKEWHLFTDFANPDDLGFVYERRVGGEVLETTRSSRRQSTAEQAYRHGSYGVKVPLFVVLGKGM